MKILRQSGWILLLICTTFSACTTISKTKLPLPSVYCTGVDPDNSQYLELNRDGTYGIILRSDTACESKVKPFNTLISNGQWSMHENIIELYALRDLKFPLKRRTLKISNVGSDLRLIPIYFGYPANGTGYSLTKNCAYQMDEVRYKDPGETYSKKWR